MAKTNGRPETPPRAERACSNCDHSRQIGNELRCWVDPPEPFIAHMAPASYEGGLPRPVVVPIQRPVWPYYCCKRWEVRWPDHPDLQVTEEPVIEIEIIHPAPEARQ